MMQTRITEPEIEIISISENTCREPEIDIDIEIEEAPRMRFDRTKIMHDNIEIAIDYYTKAASLSTFVTIDYEVIEIIEGYIVHDTFIRLQEMYRIPSPEPI